MTSNITFRNVVAAGVVFGLSFASVLIRPQESARPGALASAAGASVKPEGGNTAATGTVAAAYASAPISAAAPASPTLHETSGPGVLYVETVTSSAVKQVSGGRIGDTFVACSFAGGADRIVSHRGDGTWSEVRADGTTVTLTTWGNRAGDVPLCADRNGDGRDEFVIYRPAEATFYVKYLDGRSQTQRFGAPGDLPFAGDLLGLGRDLFGVFRPLTGEWKMEPIGDVAIAVPTSFGSQGDVPVVGDVDGDGKDEYGVVSPEAKWSMRSFTTSGRVTKMARNFGKRGDKPVIGDFDGDGRVGMAVARRVESAPAAGKVAWGKVEPRQLSFSGEALDPDVPGGPVRIAVSVDGKLVHRLTAAAPNKRGAARFSASIDLPVSAKWVCVDAENNLPGPVGRLGCENFANFDKPHGSFFFLATDARQRPARFNPCSVHRYVINKAGMPRREFEDDIHKSFQLLTEATGVRFAFEGYVNEPAVAGRLAYDHARYPERWAPILIAYSNPSKLPMLYGSVAAFAGPRYFSTPTGLVSTSGSAVIDATDVARMPAGFGYGQTHGKVLLHELGHIAGLHHYPGASELMHPVIQRRSGGFVGGDLVGLRALGSDRGCTPAIPVTRASGYPKAASYDPDGLAPAPESGEDALVPIG